MQRPFLTTIALSVLSQSSQWFTSPFMVYVLRYTTMVYRRPTRRNIMPEAFPFILSAKKHEQPANPQRRAKGSLHVLPPPEQLCLLNLGCSSNEQENNEVPEESGLPFGT